MLTNKEIEVLCYCRGCLNRKCGLDLERSDIKHLKMQKISLEKSLTMIWEKSLDIRFALKRLNDAYPSKIRIKTY